MTCHFSLVILFYKYTLWEVLDVIWSKRVEKKFYSEKWYGGTVLGSNQGSRVFFSNAWISGHLYWCYQCILDCAWRENVTVHCIRAKYPLLIYSFVFWGSSVRSLIRLYNNLIWDDETQNNISTSINQKNRFPALVKWIFLPQENKFLISIKLNFNLGGINF